MDDNFKEIFDQPFPIHEATLLTEANVASTFAPAAYDRCLVWVNHTVYGKVLYASDGTQWLPFDPIHRITRSTTGDVTYTNAEMAQIILVGNTLPDTHTLPPAATMKGRTMIFKTLFAGTLTVDGNAAETIDGALTATITVQYGVLRCFCDGTVWHLL
jgi:hypothetical protein